MNIFEKMENLQQKPKHIKKRILTITVTIIMAIIIALWINDLKYSFKKEEKEKPPGPFSVFRKAVLNSIETFKTELK